MKITQAIYKLTPFKKTLYTIYKNIFGIHKNFENLRFNGSFKVSVPEYKTSFKAENRYFLHRESDIFWRGIYSGFECLSLKIWSEVANNSTNAIDVGANTGIFSLLAKAINNNTNVYAFEPIPFNIDLLKKNINLNNFDINVITKAASNSNGECIMHVKPDTVNYMTSVNLNREPSEKSIELTVPLIKLDTFCKKEITGKVGIVKIDVEGHEIEVLEGMSEIISKDSPTLIIEVLSDEIGLKITEFFKDLPYQFYRIDENYLKKEDQKATRVNKITNSNGQNYLICTNEVAGILNAKKII